MNQKNDRMEYEGAPSGVEGGRRPTGTPEGARTTETLPKATRRTYSAEYKRRIVRQAADCQPGQIGALLRREGLYTSQLSTWRRQHERGALKALSQSRGRRPSRLIANQELSRLEKENARLKEELRKAQVIIEVQKKVSTLLSQFEGPSQEPPNR